MKNHENQKEINRSGIDIQSCNPDFRGGRSPTTIFADSINHTHIWATKYDDKDHWEYCTVCGEIQDKEPHTLTGNGQSMAHCTNFYNNAYRKICNCGYQSKPFIIIHGRYENWKESRTLNYNGASGSKLDNLLQISKTEFESCKAELSKKACVSQTGLVWTDDDGDGYGWVFCGGIVLKSSGVKGTIELITGSEGDCGRKRPFDEAYALAKYLASTSSPSRMEFVKWLKSRINSKNNPSNHLLNGYDEKYENKVTDEQFNALIKEFSGYNLGSSSPSWLVMFIQKGAHDGPGNAIYTDSSCYDSSNNHYMSDSDGIKTDCDICGAHWTGNEHYESDTWYVCWMSCSGIKDGETVKCNGHNVYGREYMGKVYDTYTKKDGQYYRVKVEAVPADGYAATISCTPNLQIPRNTNYNVSAYSYFGCVKFSNGTASRLIHCGVGYPYIDEEAPIISAVTMTPQTSSNGWATISQLDVSGTENYCNMVYLTITNKSSGKVILDSAAIQVADKKYSYSATPPLEGSEVGTVYTASVKDLYGHIATKDFTVYNTDGTAPQTESKLSYTDWTSTAKTITLTFTDYGSGNVHASLGDQIHYQACTKTADGKYQITYTFSDNIIGTKDYELYIKDALGNATSCTLTIGNIDKNTYNISYNLNGGTMSGQKTSYTVVDSFTLPQPTRTGYTFTGWTGSNGTTPQKTVTVNKGTRGNLSYTANWVPVSWTVKYDANGGSGTMTDTKHTYNAHIPISYNEFSRTGYIFNGWQASRVRDGKTEWLCGNTDGSWIGGGEWYEKDKIPSNRKIFYWASYEQSTQTTYIDGDVITLHAQWTYNPVSVKVPQILIGDHTGKSQFLVKCDDFKAGNIKVAVPSSFPYKQTGKAYVTATITAKSGNNTITPSNKVCVYNITTKSGLTAGCWSGSFNIGLTLTKE